MLNQTIQPSETIATAASVAKKLQTNIADTTESTMVALKSEAEHLSRATREVASLVGAEVGKRPLTYTLAAAGAGALVGLSVMALLNRSKTTTH